MEKRKIEQVEDLDVYQTFFSLAIDVEKVSKTWSSDFRWLRIQMLRSSESVCANLTEGFYSQYSDLPPFVTPGPWKLSPVLPGTGVAGYG
jgi:hypothetical protein